MKNHARLYRFAISLKDTGERLHCRPLIVLGLKIKDRACRKSINKEK